MTTTVVARGSEWSEAELNSGWGGGPEGFEARMASLVVGRFEQLAEEADCPVYWFPTLSEVHGDVDLDVEEGALDGLREQALEEVLEGLVEGTGPLADEVAEAYASGQLKAVELLVIYPQTAGAAWDILGDDAHLFDDNGGDPDGPSYYRPAYMFEPEAVDSIIAGHLGHVAWGFEEQGYRGTDDERRRMGNVAPQRWCGFSSGGDLYYITD